MLKVGSVIYENVTFLFVVFELTYYSIEQPSYKNVQLNHTLFHDL